MSVIFGQIYNTCMLSSGLVKHISSIIKTQLTKIVETLQIHWPKALQLVLLNLRSAPFETHKLSPFEESKGWLMHLASFNLQLI